MGYTIHYGPAPKIAKKRRTFHSRIWILAAMLALTILLADYFRPEEMQILKETLFPWTQPAVKDALAELITNLQDGISIGDCVTVFCEEIIQNAAS